MTANLAEVLAEEYGILSAVPLGARTMGRLLLRAQHPDGEVVVKIAEGSRQRENLLRSARALEHLAQQGYPAPELIRSRSGAGVVEREFGAILATSRIPGVVPRSSPATFEKLGQLLAALHVMPPVEQECPITGQGVLGEASLLAERLPVEERRLFVGLADRFPALDTLPRTFIHADPTIANLIETPKGALVLVDWDEAGMGASMLDLGAHLIGSFVSEDLDFAEVSCRRLFAAYRRRRALGAREEQSLFASGLLHAMRSVAWGDPGRRWRRVRWALANEGRLLDAALG